MGGVEKCKIFSIRENVKKNLPTTYDLQSGRIEYKHLQCDNRIKNPDIKDIGIANPDERQRTE